MAKSVLALSCDDRAGLTVIRSLGRAGIKVDVGWSTNRCAINSRYVRAVHNLPDPNSVTNAWLIAIKDLVARADYDLIIPCDDHAIIPIQRQKDELEKISRVYALSDRAFITTFDKFQTTLLAERCGVQLPRWAVVRSLDERDSITAAFNLPVVLKPISSFDLRRALVRREVKISRDRSDLTSTLTSMLGDGAVLIQEYFHGKGAGVELLVKDGAVLAAFQHERVHEPPRGGGSSYRRSVPLDNRLMRAAEALVADLSYTGLIMIEFRIDPESRNWIFVETNARFWGSLPLAVAAGVDFPRYLYEMLVEGRSDFPKSYKYDVYCRNMRLDISWLKSNFSADRGDPTQQIVPLRQIFWELRSVVKFSEHIDTFALDDPLPFLTEIREIAQRAIRYLIKNVARFIGLPTLLNRRRLRIVNQIKGARTVTFACYGNICRSPFAEAYARKIAPEYIAFNSAGTYQEYDRRAPNEAVAAAAAYGLDLTSHRSRTISNELVNSADLIFVFDRHNLQEISHKFPSARNRIVELGLFQTAFDKEIADPFGRSAKDFAECYRKIVTALSNISRECWMPRE